ncbi:MAG: 2-dehydro-3-deoxygalactonokinase [Stomatobaculum sp.]
MTMNKYIVYFDSGTSNSRIYLLDQNFHIVYVAKKNIGSKDSSIAGNNKILIEGLYDLYCKLLEENNLQDQDIKHVYMSGMVTSPYGLKEVPHLELPLKIADFKKGVCCYFEEEFFDRDIYLVPGLKTVSDDFSMIGNMRGEEIELVGTVDKLKTKGITRAALIMPGSHTHVTYLKDDEIVDIISNFTGELFYALKKDTILSPVLHENMSSSELDEAAVQEAIWNLERFGFNRALYIGHAMRIMNQGTTTQRFSYLEGVINGGIRTAVDYYCANRWQGCDTLIVVSEEFMYRLFSMIFKKSMYIRNIVWLPISETESYAVRGLEKILKSDQK